MRVSGRKTRYDGPLRPGNIRRVVRAVGDYTKDGQVSYRGSITGWTLLVGWETCKKKKDEDACLRIRWRWQHGLAVWGLRPELAGEDSSPRNAPFPIHVSNFRLGW